MKAIEAARADLERARPQFDRITAIADEIALERVRQIEQEGYTPPERDLRHDEGQLAMAAASTALTAVAEGWRRVEERRAILAVAADVWPFERQAHTAKPARRHLVIAAALILAEIERLDRKIARGNA